MSGNLLSGLLNRVKESNLTNGTGEDPEAKRPRLVEQQSFPKLFNILYHNLTEMKRMAEANPSIDVSKLEIEVRIGMLTKDDIRWQAQVAKSPPEGIMIGESERTTNGLEFKAGCDAGFLKHHLNAVFSNKHAFTEVPVTPQRIRGMDNSRRRWAVNSQGETVMSEDKDNIFKTNVALLCHEYDLRMSLAVETPANTAANVGVGLDVAKWKYERFKRRRSFESERMFPHWKVDMTEVDVILRTLSIDGTLSPSATRTEYELEFEMNMKSLLFWIALSNPTEIDKCTVDLATSLFHLLNAAIPNTSENVVDAGLERCIGPKYDREIERINRLIDNNLGFEFIGSMPYNMSRSCLPPLKHGNYFLTEKSDGTRYLIYVINNPVSKPAAPLAVLINRSKEIYKLPGSLQLGSCLRVGTVLDGELVYNKSHRRQMYLAFDVLSIDSSSLVAKKFEHRLSFLDGQVKDRLVSYMEKLMSRTEPFAGVMIDRKKYVRKVSIRQLMSNIQMVDGERVYRERDGRRHHKTDGIILQPDGPYRFGSDELLLKWKWADLRTVDLEVSVITSPQRGDRIVRLLCDGPDGVSIDCTKRGGGHVGLGTFDAMRLLADMAAHARVHPQKKCIAEVMFDSTLGQWRYHRIRADKSRANHIDVVMSIFIEQAENIGVEELQYELVTSHARSFQDILAERMAEIMNSIPHT